ncbi:MAG: FecR domain-containing protein [Cyclobacteriaceae bacterium]
MKSHPVFKAARKFLSSASAEKEKQDFSDLLDGLAERGKSPDKETLDNSRKKVMDNLAKSREQAAKGQPLFLAIKRYAAVLLVFMVVGAAYYQVRQTTQKAPLLISKITGTGMRSTLILEDGSRVRLNENSRLEFPEYFEDGVRKVVLKGEAFFDIQADAQRPFVVVSDQSEVTVLGTSFNINTHHATEVTVASGKVKVADRHSLEQAFLQPGQQAIMDGKAIRIKKVNPEYFIGWHTRRLSFEEEPVEKVFEILERAYGVTIYTQIPTAKQECLITGSYEGERIETILRGMENLLDFKYETDISTRTITIKIIKCK